MILPFDPVPHLESYFRDLNNPNPDFYEILRAMEIIRRGLDSPTDWSNDEFLVTCLVHPGQPDHGSSPEELQSAVARCLEETLWLRTRLPGAERFNSGQRRFYDKAFAIDELKRLRRTLQSKADQARVEATFLKLFAVTPLDTAYSREDWDLLHAGGKPASTFSLNQPVMILRHVLAQRLLLERFLNLGLAQTLDLLQAKWDQLLADRAELAKKKPVRSEMEKVIRRLFDEANPRLDPAGHRRWSVTGDAGDILGWLHETTPGSYEIVDEWGLPVAFHSPHRDTFSFNDLFT